MATILKAEKLRVEYRSREMRQATKVALAGLDLDAFTSGAGEGNRNPFGGATAGETPRSVTPGELFHVRVHASHAAS